jgi:hypothetical protein
MEVNGIAWKSSGVLSTIAELGAAALKRKSNDRIPALDKFSGEFRLIEHLLDLQTIACLIGDAGTIAPPEFDPA